MEEDATAYAHLRESGISDPHGVETDTSRDVLSFISEDIEVPDYPPDNTADTDNGVMERILTETEGTGGSIADIYEANRAAAPTFVAPLDDPNSTRSSTTDDGFDAAGKAS